MDNVLEEYIDAVNGDDSAAIDEHLLCDLYLEMPIDSDYVDQSWLHDADDGVSLEL
jgi:hypothetical protein